MICVLGEPVKKRADQKNDEKLLTRIRGYDLFCCEARYHPKCRRNYFNYHKPSSNMEEVERQKELEEAHNYVFMKICDIIDDRIIENNTVMKLSDLCNEYTTLLSTTNYPSIYRNEKLKKKMLSKYDDKISFTLDSTVGYLVYNSSISTDVAIKTAYELGCRDIFQDVAKNLRQVILDAFSKCDTMPWPPTQQYLTNLDVIPSQLTTFLQMLLSDRKDKQSAKLNRLVHSLAQDICRAVTGGEWKMPKHVLMCMTLRHLFRSAELITLINRFGHCENYSFTLELETAIAKAVNETSDLLSLQIIRNPSAASVFHSEFDNFDQLINTLSGMDSVHTAHGIMLQDIAGSVEDFGGTVPNLIEVKRDRKRSLDKCPDKELPECYVSQRKSPRLQVDEISNDENRNAFIKSQNLYTIWIKLRALYDKQEVPGWSGFISLLGNVPENLTRLDYYPVIPHPITQYSTVQECLRYAQNATAEVGQKYTITTFDLGVIMKAYPLVWNDIEKYKDHIILIGTFHCEMGYLKMIGKKMNGSGFSDIILEAGLISGGSIQGVISGKHFERSMNCHKSVAESLERQLMVKFNSVSDIILSDETKTAIDHMAKCPSSENLTNLQKCQDFCNYIKEYEKFRNGVKEGTLGKTPQFWLSYVDHVKLVLSMSDAVKNKNVPLYIHCNYSMPDLFFAYGGQNYARYLTYYSQYLTNIENTHPGARQLLERGAIGVARSHIPGNLCDVDKTMEETFMRHSKSRGGAGGGGVGMTGLLTSNESSQRWVRTTHERTKYLQYTLQMADMVHGSVNKHHDLRPTEITKSEKQVQKVTKAFEGFVKPFDIEDKERLYNVSSGAPVPMDIEEDILCAESIGKKLKMAFIEDRIKGNTDFFDPIKRLNLKTMAIANKTTKLKNSNNKLFEYQQSASIAFQLLIKAQGLQLDLKLVLAYPLTVVPLSLATADGYMFHANKAKGFNLLVKGIPNSPIPPSDKTLCILDGNSTFYYLKKIPANFNMICEKIFDFIPPTGDSVFSTDMYNAHSIKSMTRETRGTSEKLIVKGANTKKPKDWKLFLQNSDNKIQLCNILHQVWKQDIFATKLQSKSVVIVVEGTAYKLYSDDGKTVQETEIYPLKSNQEETDHRQIVYIEYAEKEGYDYVRVKGIDSDMFFILLHYANMLKIRVIYDTGTGNNKKLLDITEMAENFTQQYCTAYMCLHIFTGCDSTSHFKGIGKERPIKKVQKMPKFISVLSKLGDSWDVSKDLLDALDEFTCAMYGYHRFKSVNELRHHMIMKKSDGKKLLDCSKTIGLASLPPCRAVLDQHCSRANYQVY